MSTIIARMMQRLFPTKERRILIIGNDAAGKTTILYQMKLGKVVTTIPTIGFNVETIQFKTFSFTMWDVGGRDKIRPLWRHYFQGTSALICVVDSNDRDRIQDLLEDLDRILDNDDLWGCALLLYANKQDLPGAMPAAEVVEKLNLRRVTNKRWAVVPCCATTGDGLSDGLEWLSNVLQNRNTGAETFPTGGGSSSTGSKDYPGVILNGPSPEQAEAKRKEDMFTEWFERDDNQDEEFLEQLATCTLEIWDHRTLLRICWLFLSREGRQKGLPLIFKSIKNFLETSGKDLQSQVTTFHETLMYFWVHIVHYSIASNANPSGDFKGFLIMSPQLSDENFFLNYYTTELVLHKPEARIQVVLPDKKPLPSLVSDTQATNRSYADAPVEQRLAPARPLDDGAFLERLAAGTLPSWGHEAKIRAIWCLLQAHGRRKGGTGTIMEAIQKVEGVGYNLTSNYFWIQMVTMASAQTEDNADFATFIQNSACTQLLDPDLIKTHYSDRAIETGAHEFVLPDKKPLPNLVR